MSTSTLLAFPTGCKSVLKSIAMPYFRKQSAITALLQVGVDPSVVVVDEGFAKSNTSIKLQEDIYAFIFNQKVLMAGLGIQGNKITKLLK